jgi:hypothetical protein
MVMMLINNHLIWRHERRLQKLEDQHKEQTKWQHPKQT